MLDAAGIRRAPDPPRSGAGIAAGRQLTANFSSLIAAKSLTSPPTRLDA